MATLNEGGGSAPSNEESLVKEGGEAEATATVAAAAAEAAGTPASSASSPLPPALSVADFLTQSSNVCATIPLHSLLHASSIGFVTSRCSGRWRLQLIVYALRFSCAFS